jgi:hypothetical protein
LLGDQTSTNPITAATSWEQPEPCGAPLPDEPTKAFRIRIVIRDVPVLPGCTELEFRFYRNLADLAVA